MPSHVPRTTAEKQLESLAKREGKLRALLAHDGSAEKIGEAVESIRQAQLSVLKARRSHLEYKKELVPVQLSNIASEEAEWLQMSQADLLARYQY